MSESAIEYVNDPPNEPAFKTSYLVIFMLFYLAEGLVQGIPPALFPIYLTQELGGYDIALWLQISFITNIPWTIKFIVGIINDKWGSKKYGRRFPWIISFGIFGGSFWLVLMILLPLTNGNALYDLFLWCWFFTALGMAFADTALDGLILDVTPKEKIGKVQAMTWTMLLIGMGLGSALLGYAFLLTNTLPVFFGITGGIMIISCIIPRMISEPPLTPSKPIARQVLTIITQKKNYKVFALSIVSAMVGVIIITFYGYLILIDLDVISVQDTLLSLQNGTSVDLFEWGIVFYGSNGIGIIIGSLITAKIADKKRKSSMLIAFAIFIPFCLLSNVFIGVVLGIIGQIIFGMGNGSLDTAESTLRADFARNYYPELKSFYYAILISFWNVGMSLGNFAGSRIFIWLASVGLEFNQIYFVLSMFCIALLCISWLCFKIINPADYEFSKNLESNKKTDTFFG